jgi:uncharacterized protein (UPF0332 family)
VFEWLDFLELAEELAAWPSHEEAAARTSISRAYYAAFHAGRDYIARSGIAVDRSRSSHVQVQNELRKRNQELANDLGRLHEWRKIADYEVVGFPDVGEQALNALILAKDCIARIQSMN